MVKSLCDCFAIRFGISIVSSVGSKCYGWSTVAAMSILARIWVHDAGKREDQMGQMSSTLEPNVTKLARFKPLVQI